MRLAHSHVRQLLGRGEGWMDSCAHRTYSNDTELLSELHRAIAELPFATAGVEVAPFATWLGHVDKAIHRLRRSVTLLR